MYIEIRNKTRVQRGKNSLLRCSRLTFAVQNGNVICGQARLGLDCYQQGGASARGNTLAGEVLRFDGNGEGALLKKGKA